jgi:ABC-2 type transport system permease protein
MSETLPGRDVTRPLPFWAAVRGVFGLSLEGMVWSRRSLFMAMLLGLPVVLAAVYRGIVAAEIPTMLGGVDLYGHVVAVFYVRNLLPLAALFYATSLIADEVDWRTITYLLTRPLRRDAILVGKFAAYMATTLSLTLPAITVTFFLLVTVEGWSGAGTRAPDLLRDLGVSALALVAYGAAFTFLGVLLRRPMIPGLLFLFVWELVANLPGYMPRFTITAYLRSLVPYHSVGDGLSEIFGQVLPTLLCLEVLAGMIVCFLLAAGWIFSVREYVLEQ